MDDPGILILDPIQWQDLQEQAKLYRHDCNRDGLVAICVVTMNRPELIMKCLGPSLEQADYPYELLVWDNHSYDRRVVDYVASLKPAWLHLHHENIGYAKAVNQLIVNASRRVNYIFVLDPDLLMPPNWVSQLVSYYEAIPNSGLAAIHCVEGLGIQTVVCGKRVHIQKSVFGIKFFGMDVLRDFGYFYDGFGLYGCEDADYNARLSKGGRTNYYLSGIKCDHYGSADTPAYRKFKDEALSVAGPVLDERLKLYDQGLELYCPPPVPLALREE